jgi:hypothetical protein
VLTPVNWCWFAQSFSEFDLDGHASRMLPSEHLAPQAETMLSLGSLVPTFAGGDYPQQMRAQAPRDHDIV